MPDPRTRPRPDPSGSPAERAGMSVAEYDYRVRDMAKNLVHPTAFYVVLQVIGLTRILSHPSMEQPGSGWWRELGLFGAGFLGAWAVLLSTLLRDAGLRSATVTVLVPLAAAGVLVVYLALPEPAVMTERELWLASLALVGPAPIAWAGTVVRWYRARRDVAGILAGDDA